jgi:hypothetical protein
MIESFPEINAITASHNSLKHCTMKRGNGDTWHKELATFRVLPSEMWSSRYLSGLGKDGTKE